MTFLGYWSQSLSLSCSNLYLSIFISSHLSLFLMPCFFLLLHLRGCAGRGGRGTGKFCIHFLNLPIRGCLAVSLPTPTYCQGALLLARSLRAFVQVGLDSNWVIPLLLRWKYVCQKLES